MRILLIMYYLVLMYKTIKNTPINMNEEKYKQFIQENLDNINITMSRFPPAYQNFLIGISLIIGVFCILCHVIISIYVGIISYLPIVKVLCGLEAVCSIYGALVYWKDAYGMVFERKKVVYHKFVTRFCMVLSYVCYTLVLVSLLAF